MASIFLVGSGHYGCGKFGDVLYAWIIADRDEFIRNDKGGHIYVLPSDDFEINQGRGLGNDEYASNKPVKPIKIMEYSSALEAMMEQGVQVYFVDKEIYEKIEISSDYGRAVFSGPESENQRRDKNIRKFPENSNFKILNVSNL